MKTLAFQRAEPLLQELRQAQLEQDLALQEREREKQEREFMRHEELLLRDLKRQEEKLAKEAIKLQAKQELEEAK